MKQKVLITGATGFIGSHLAREIYKVGQYDIVCLIRKTSDTNVIKDLAGIQFAQGDLLDEKLDNRILDHVDIIFHLAGQIGKYGIEYDDYYQLNCRATENLLALAEQEGVKQFIYCSTPGVLGFGKRLADENELYEPRNAYEKTKAQAEQIIKDFCINSKIKFTIIRPDFVYGPGDYRRIKMYENIKNKRFILTTSGKSYLHPTYIDDVIQGFMKCIGNEKAFNEIFNIAAKEDITSKEYIQTIANVYGERMIQVNVGYGFSVFIANLIDNLTRRLKNKEGFVSKNKIDFLAIDHSSHIGKAERLLGYVPEYTFAQGILKTIDWVKGSDINK
jgi:Nucleoside-diphosphate-sugar epimerases